jgi:hypothetical protein
MVSQRDPEFFDLSLEFADAVALKSWCCRHAVKVVT